MDETTQIPNPIDDDAMTEAAVLRQLLALHPIQLSFSELVREVSGGPEDFAATDPVDRAVRQLGAAGLLHREGDTIRPSRAALRFHELFEVS